MFSFHSNHTPSALFIYVFLLRRLGANGFPQNFFLPVIRPAGAGVRAAMSASISISSRTCHNEKKAGVFPLSRVQHGLKMKRTDRNLPEPDLSPAQLCDLLGRVGTERSVAAFETIFRYYGPRVRSFMAMKTRDAQLAEELMQETMAAVWNKATQFDPDRGNVSAWIFTIARNQRIDAFRRKRPAFDENDPVFVADNGPLADVELEGRQDAELLRKAMESLPPEQLDVLKRAFFDEASHSTIAEDMGIPLGTVKSRIRLAFEKLRTTLEGRR
ncbi:RNA polymerase sigma-70 factor (ECF subfamily) [Neorhizobium galegae]|uniref:sigma-70 family RNA polymerase sigma factor n=1 Tax=Neorhizobium galegae TaxID=399 RepID=UPI0032AE84A3|nr:RNA polymerase sigma-70 factor (ECF subfamily) [Neorhizobium galegae]